MEPEEPKQDDREDDDPFEHWRVVRNGRGDHSIWPSIKALPDGWEGLGVEGSRHACLDWIERNWSGPSL
ncbi:hypothetical protein R70006_04885 [Paraburkholderia domus]|uniref:MbtH family NRPS accessory protein n=1 Tax=Paraburkholderia domus TaxID=2793075 RepID=UPI001912158F|nr:MbtH family NRPS accessory protein [Paraburkholderia domus]MBK5051592.1 MbtH family protein [Burkholderia sp. R-70006]CAE6791768.1 hypothetical protein R70006_04885 [Paraburkholderia domus]CAE6795739.1 hypothetical protein R75483_05107 [Paraburkholderia domus]